MQRMVRPLAGTMDGRCSVMVRGAEPSPNRRRACDVPAPARIEPLRPATSLELRDGGGPVLHDGAAMTDYVIHHLGPFDVPGLRPRTVRVHAPPRDQNRGPSPVLYMFDGQNVFDDAPSYAGGWHLHRTARSLWKKHGRAPVIV